MASGKFEPHKPCRVLAMNLVKCLDQSACVQEEKRSYKECALEKNLTAPPACIDIRDKYMECKQEHVEQVVRERLLIKPDLLKDA